MPDPLANSTDGFIVSQRNVMFIISLTTTVAGDVTRLGTLIATICDISHAVHHHRGGAKSLHKTSGSGRDVQTQVDHE